MLRSNMNTLSKTITILAISQFGLLACSTMNASMHPVAVPQNLAPAANEKYAFALPAKGVQIYECRMVDGKAGWAFVAPEAELFDTSGKLVGKHYGGPTWESNDGSKIVGTVKQRADAKTANDIPWLLLSAKSTGPNGAMAAVTSIQRVNTVSGVAPADGCVAGKVGTVARVPYTADYYYFVGK
jgi:Protein of unknown function (DUF3455)